MTNILKLFALNIDGRNAAACRARNQKEAASILNVSVHSLRVAKVGIRAAEHLPDGVGPFYKPLDDYADRHPWRTTRWRIVHDANGRASYE